MMQAGRESPNSHRLCSESIAAAAHTVGKRERNQFLGLNVSWGGGRGGGRKG